MKALGSVSWTPQEITISPPLPPSFCVPARLRPTLCGPMDCSPLARVLCLWNSPSENTAVGWHFLLQGIFMTQGLNTHLLRLLHWRVDSLPLCHLGRPPELLPNTYAYHSAFSSSYVLVLVRDYLLF